MKEILGILADILQIAQVFNFDKVTNIPNTNAVIILLILIAWFNSNRKKDKEIHAMQREIDKMASTIRVLREDSLIKKGINREDINKLFPPDDKLRSRRKK